MSNRSPVSGSSDRWSEDNVQFVFGMDAKPNLVAIAETLEKDADKETWKPLRRSCSTTSIEKRRRRQFNHKQAFVIEKVFRARVKDFSTSREPSREAEEVIVFQEWSFRTSDSKRSGLRSSMTNRRSVLVRIE